MADIAAAPFIRFLLTFMHWPRRAPANTYWLPRPCPRVTFCRRFFLKKAGFPRTVDRAANCFFRAALIAMLMPMRIQIARMPSKACVSVLATRFLPDRARVARRAPHALIRP
jgi:hypothetical protein